MPNATCIVLHLIYVALHCGLLCCAALCYIVLCAALYMYNCVVLCCVVKFLWSVLICCETQTKALLSDCLWEDISVSKAQKKSQRGQETSQQSNDHDNCCKNCSSIHKHTAFTYNSDVTTDEIK